MSIREQILNAKDFKTESVDIPEWKCKVLVRSISIGKMKAIEFTTGPEALNGLLRLVVNCVIEEDGSLAFNAADIESLLEKDRSAIWKLIEACLRINGLSKQDGEALAKN